MSAGFGGSGGGSGAVGISAGGGGSASAITATGAGGLEGLLGAPEGGGNSDSAVNDLLQRKLGMSRAEFFHTYFTGQKELAELRPPFRGRCYVGIDTRPGPGVDLMADVRVRELAPDDIAPFDPDGLLLLNVNTADDLDRAERAARPPGAVCRAIDGL